jgi:hypothetical protein
MASPNIVNVSSITGKTAAQLVGTSATAIITNAAASGKVLKVNALLAGNIDATTAYDLTVDLFRSSVAYRFIATVSIPAKSTLDVLGKSIYLEEGDSLRLTASAASKIEAVASYEDIS